MKRVDLTGQVFGYLTVIKLGETAEYGKNKTKRKTWVCQCQCGKIVNILASNLRRGKPNSTSCGCKAKTSIKYNFKDLTGLKYGQLTVVNKTDKYTKTRGCIWNCLCDCGLNCEVPTNSLTSGNKTTCGNKNNHYRSDLDPFYHRIGEIPLSHFNAIKQNAIKRNLSFNVDGEFLSNLYIQQNKLCALSGVPIFFTQDRNASKTRNQTSASLDRIDSSIGYEKGNVQWVDKQINIMKQSLSDKNFIELSRLVHLNSIKNRPRPSFDEYFLRLAFNIAIRSDDPNIKHGSVIVNQHNHIIGTGYNNTIIGADPSKIPYDVRDDKRLYMVHSEKNAILNCNRTAGDSALTIYVTGLPCIDCLQHIINFRIKRIVYADRIGSITENEKIDRVRQNILSMSNLIIDKIPLDNIWLKDLVV